MRRVLQEYLSLIEGHRAKGEEHRAKGAGCRVQGAVVRTKGLYFGISTFNALITTE
jgi:hypothetical protein